MKLFAAGIGIFLIALFASNIDNYTQRSVISENIAHFGQDIFYKIFGEFREYLSWMSFLNADLFFHGGVSVKGERGASHMLEALKEEGTRRREHHDRGRQVVPSLNILLDIHNAITIEAHRHLSGNEEKELLPWLYYATKLDPHNTFAYSVTAYWLGVRLKKPKEAIRFLLLGLTDNPDSWELYRSIGEICYIAEKDFGKAFRYLKKAKDLAELKNIDKTEKRMIYVPLAESYLLQGMPRESLKLYEALSLDFPDDTTIQKRIEFFKRQIQRMR